MADDEVTRNLKGMDKLDFVGWNSADWHGVFARYHTGDVLVDVHGQAQTHGIQEHIDAMRAFVEATGGTPIPRVARPSRSRPTRSDSDPESGRAWSERSKVVAGW